jgi:hypothetical protein
MNLDRRRGDKSANEPRIRAVREEPGLMIDRPETKGLLHLFLAARKPACPLCGSTQWRALEVLTTGGKETGGAWQQVVARSPCGHQMNFTERMLRSGPQDDRKLLRRCA